MKKTELIKNVWVYLFFYSYCYKFSQKIDYLLILNTNKTNTKKVVSFILSSTFDALYDRIYAG